MKELIETIAKALVDRPDAVAVEALDGNYTSILRISVGVGDAGKIIGKKGRTADAIRVILNAVATKEHKRVVLEVEDDRSRATRTVQTLDPMPLAHRRRDRGDRPRLSA